jgi:membrane protease YdiL (CAAX protease family)
VTAESWSEIGKMATAGGIVASVAISFAVITGAVVLRRQVALLPRWKPWRVPWGGFEILAIFLVTLILVPDLVISCGIARRNSSLVAFPIQLGILIACWRVFYPQWKPFRRDMAVFKSDPASLDQPIPMGAAFARAMTLAVLAWAILTPIVMVIHGLVNWVFTQIDVTPEQHPLTELARGEGWEQLSFLLQACLVAPIIEELVFRGILLPWMVGARERNTGVLQTSPVGPSSARPILVMAIAVGMPIAALIIALINGSSRKIDPVIFACVLTIGLAVLWIGVRHGRRHYRAVFVSAAFFALVHSAVWPTPIPLFFLGLGLGWLAIRTRGIFVPVIVHGLFNAVSAVYVLRGAA